MLYLIQLPLRKGEHETVRTIVFVSKLILIPVIALLFVAIEWSVSYVRGDVLCAIYVALIADVV